MTYQTAVALNRTLLKSLPFDIAARLPLQLGRESIASATAAVAELIKNSYDANAENVRLSFLKRSAPVKVLQIEDDGDGMDLQTLEKVWLRIGTDHKVENERSGRKKRIMTGAKGLGRLGIDRLCRQLVLQTKTKEMDHVLEVRVDWGRYDDRSATISSINHKIFRIPSLKNKHSDFFEGKDSGTRLVLVGMREDWPDKRIEELRTELSMLVTPFSNVDDFSIDFRSGLNEVDGKLTSDKYLEAAVWFVKASLDVAGNIKVEFSQPHKDKPVSPLITSWNDWLPERENGPRCGPLEFHFYYIPQPSAEISTSLKKKGWSQFMSLNHGVRIYRDHFRVRPFGEPSGRGDWLGLGYRKSSNPSGIRQGNWRVAPQQALGAIFISRIDNAQLVDQANREGIVESDAFWDMRSFALKVISVFELTATTHARLEFPTDSIEKHNRDLSRSIDKSKEAVAGLRKAVIAQDVLPPEALEEKIRAVEEFVAATEAASVKQKEAYTQKREELEREKDTLANLASIGILAVCFGHEAKEFCNLAASAASELRYDFQEGKFMVSPDKEADILAGIDVIIHSTKFIKNYAAFSLGNVRAEKRKKRKFNLRNVVTRVFSALEESLIRQKIEYDFSEIDIGLSDIFAYEIDWESILVNMISNSIWALSQKKPGERFIKVKARNVENGVELAFADSGKGLEQGTEHLIFDPMFSTRQDEKGNNVGTGMGLSIVRTFVNEHSGGKIVAAAKSDVGGAEFTIFIPTEGKP
ncbi:ATP-binding protein [Pseudoduganella sp. UC29_71]|uniref:sensor histidine kinase n=1 Tax=Pseudoduganella sp. UC29_71 TaxID=3350174 RepID=UPI00366D6681